MKLSTRYAVVGLAALGVLSLVHWVRGLPYRGGGIPAYLIGVLPNVAAALAIPFVLLSIWAEQRREVTPAAARQFFVRLTLVTGVGLIGWEFLQQGSRRLVFDEHDIGATLVGLLLGWMIFRWLTSRSLAAEA